MVRFHLTPLHGLVAPTVEQFPCKEKVEGSNPSTYTMNKPPKDDIQKPFGTCIVVLGVISAIIIVLFAFIL